MELKVESSYDYKDMSVEVMEGVFAPNKTTELLLEALLANPLAGKSCLDLGTGSGVVALSLKKVGGAASVCGSDISVNAVMNAQHNAKRLNLDVEFRQGSVFEPWEDRKFDIISNDISGVAEPIARLSPWYPPGIFCEAGEEGVNWTIKVLDLAHKHLNPGGVIYFPTVSLSNELKILEAARLRYPRVVRVLNRAWPFKEDFWKRITDSEACRKLIDKGIVKVFKRGSRTLWDTTVYMASVTP
jgi:methylase of polypeptide subunit release factors